MTLTSPSMRPPSRPAGPRAATAVCNQKGGAGKTTTAASVAAELARRGRPARMHDMDAQAGSLTGWFPPQWDDAPEGERYDMSHVLGGECTIDQATWPTTVPNLYIVPSFRTLNGWANARPVGAEHALRGALEGSELDVEDVIDCAPSLDLLTVAALATAKGLIVPLRASGLDLEGVAELNQTIELVQQRINADLRVVAVVLCGKLESKLTESVFERLREDYPDAFATKVRNTVRMQEAPLYGKAIHEYAPGCTADEDYRVLAAELFGREAD